MREELLRQLDELRFLGVALVIAKGAEGVALFAKWIRGVEAAMDAIEPHKGNHGQG